MGWQEVQYGALNLLEIVIKQENLLMLHKKLVPNSMNYHTNKNRTLMIHELLVTFKHFKYLFYLYCSLIYWLFYVALQASLEVDIVAYGGTVSDFKLFIMNH